RTPLTASLGRKSKSDNLPAPSPSLYQSRLLSLSSNSMPPDRTVKPAGHAGSRLPSTVTRLTTSSPGSSICTQGLVPLAAASPPAVNHDVFGSPSMTFSGPQVGQEVLAVTFNLPRYSLKSALLFSTFSRSGAAS